MPNLRSLLLVILFFVISNKSYSQFFIKEYELKISEANHFLAMEQFDSAAISFDIALEIVDGIFPFSIYHIEAAKSWTMAGDKERAFYHISLFLKRGWTDIDSINNVKMLDSLHSDIRWQPVLDSIEVKYHKYKDVQKELEEIGFADQVFRRMQNCMKKDSLNISFFNSLSERQDLENLKLVDSIVLVHGWLGISKIGDKANGILWRVIQHSTAEVRKKYLPMIENSVKLGETSPTDFALLVDRMLIENGKKQRYGSQFLKLPTEEENKVITIENPETINIRRRSIGLSNIEDYLRIAGIYDVTIDSMSDMSTLAHSIKQRNKRNNKN